nr:hypothetical protein [Sphingomonas daechungensis]
MERRRQARSNSFETLLERKIVGFIKFANSRRIAAAAKILE